MAIARESLAEISFLTVEIAALIAFARNDGKRNARNRAKDKKSERKRERTHFVHLGAKAEGASAANQSFYTPSAGFLDFARNDKWSLLFPKRFCLWLY